MVPRVDLDPRFYKLVDDFEARVPVPPSLRDATALVVQGDWTFAGPVRVEGELILPDRGGSAVIGA